MLDIVAKRRVETALKRSTPKVNLFDISPGEKVMVYREDPEKFEGPYELHAYDGNKAAFIKLPEKSGKLRILPFSISQVKKFRPKDKDAILKYTECEKIVRRQAFEKAIAVDDKKSLTDTIDVDSMG